MKIELTDRYARIVLCSLKDREEGLTDDLKYYEGSDIGAAIAAELSCIREVKDYLEAKLLEQ